MKEYTATELAYKNGYEAGIKKCEEIEEIKDILLLLATAIEQNTINTHQVQGNSSADVVFGILRVALAKIKNLDHPTEKGGADNGTE